VVTGRVAELDQIRAVLDEARRGRAGALLVEGDPGVGKSTLLAAATDLAPGFTRLRARGIESEATVDHAALLEVLGPLRKLLPGVPERPAAAVAAAVGWASPAGPGDRFLVGAGTLMLLAHAAEQSPVLVTVDDLHWVDRESAQALLFAARRLAADAVAFLFSARSSTALPAGADGVDRLPLAGLPHSDAIGLLPPDVAPAVADRLVAATDGNPLALLAAAGGLDRAQRVGSAPLPEPLPVGERLEGAYARLLAGLSAVAWRGVLLLAASRDEAEEPVVEALRAAGLDADAALDEAESHGVTVRDAGQLRFRHPLVRAAAWRLATPAQRREAHRAIAGVLAAGSEDRVWHVSAATSGRDDRVADELAAVADAMRARRGFAAASAALQRAAGLTTDPARAAARLAAATDDALLAGDVDRVRALADRVLAGAADPGARAQVLHTLGVVQEYAGSIARAADLQRQAAELGSGLLRARSLAQLAMIQYRLDDPAGMLASAETLAAVADPADPEQRMLSAYTLGAAQVFGGDQAAGRALMRQARDLLEDDPALRDDPRHLLPAILVGRWLSDPAAVLPYLDRRLDRARELGALGVLTVALALVGGGRAVMGDHAGAYALAGEAIELGESLGYVSELAVAYLTLAVEDAARGRHADADRSLAAARQLVERAGTGGVAEHLLRSQAFCAACRGRLEEVVALLAPRAAAPVGRSGMGGDALPVAPDLVEAYVGLGRMAEATELTERYATANPPPAGPLTDALVARCRGVVAPDLQTADACFAAALDPVAAALNPLEAARTRLLYGARLRRAGQRTAAREQLRAARDLFSAMDLTLWAARAADELAATGETARPRRPLSEEPLTSQETRVALLVARGLTNREVAATLFLSPKTVEHHLGSVFRKRGLRSRTELARAFATAVPADG